ncbi:MAG: TolB family protein [Balneola sp.]
MRRLLFLLCLMVLFPHLSLKAQVPFGGHPPSVKWYQIDTDVVRVIFPEYQTEEAKRIASLLNYLHSYHLQTVGERTKKIDVVLQTNQVISNGYVGLSPYRSEFYATPFQNTQLLGTTNWLDELAIHEYRHALQFTNANRGATKVFHVLQGQGGRAGAMVLSVPNWYFEGDAVVSETVLSNNGRGRTPSFFKEQRALLLNGIDYSYMKARNGSFKDIVPNHYRLGYAITNYGRNQFGQEVWKNILADAGAYRTIIYPFSGAMDIHTGMRAPEMYQAAYKELKDQWAEELNETELTKHVSITEKQPTVTNDQFARFLSDGNLVYINSSFKKTPAVHKIEGDQNQKITEIGASVNTFLSENNGVLAWTEYQRDARWGNRNFTKVVTFDLMSEEKKTITQKTKLFSPQVSGDGSKIAAARYTSELTSEIVLLDINSGSVLKTLQNPGNYVLSYPTWTTDNSAIVFVAQHQHQVAILRYDLNTDSITALTDWTHHSIGSLSLSNSEVVFSASYTGIDNIFSVDLDGSKTIMQHTSAKIGAYQPDISPDGKTIVFSEFTEKGHVLSSLNIEESLQRIITPEEPMDMDRFNIELADYEENILGKIPDTDFDTKPYKGFLKGTKLHDWGISGDEAEIYTRLGFTNILNDFNANLIGGYNQNEEAFRYGVSAQYGKFYPVLNFSAFNSSRNVIDQNPTDTLFIDRFEQNKISLGASVPLAWQRGNYSTGLTVGVDLAAYQLGDQFSFQNQAESLSSLELSFQFYNIRRRAYQNVQSRIGQYVFANYSKSLSNIDGERFNVQGGLFLPGLGLNHSIRVEGEYQRELSSNDYQYVDFFNYARGYSYFTFNDIARRISFNYQLPLLYPDWGFFNFAYFKRIRLNAFVDRAELELHDFNSISETPRTSYGGELMIDTVMLNVVPITFILRQSFLPDAFDGESTTNFDFLISVSL